VYLGSGNNHPVARIGVHGRQFGRADADHQVQRQHLTFSPVASIAASSAESRVFASWMLTIFI
jgi:hypothetical protein